MKSKPEYVEGPEAFTRFQDAMHKVLTVSPAEIRQRIDAENNKPRTQRKRGVKPGILNHIPRASRPKSA